MTGYSVYEPALGKQGSRAGLAQAARGCLTRSRHRFWSASETESLVFHGWADPQDKDNILDENFLRNLQGYMADCHKANLKPSVFQLALFSYEASTLATPPFWVPMPLLIAVNYMLAYWIGAGLLGYVILSDISVGCAPA
jgi:hypothetical protein